MRKLARLVYSAVVVLHNEFRVRPYRTVVQKILCLAMDPEDSSRLFVPRYWGPWSPEVAYILEALNLAGFLTSRSDDMGTWYVPHWEVRHFSEEARIRDTVAAIHGLRPEVFADLTDLRNLAKIYWLFVTHPGMGPNRLSELSKVYGWNIEPEEINRHLTCALNRFAVSHCQPSLGEDQLDRVSSSADSRRSA